MNFPITVERLKTLTDLDWKKELEQLLKIAENGAAKIAEIIGSVFIKTNTVVNGAVPEKGATIKKLLNAFEKTAKDLGITNIWIDPDITGWFGDVTVSDVIAGPSRLLRFVNAITHTKIIDGCKQLNAYQEYDLGDAITRATQLVAAGELDLQNNRGVIIYLTNRRDGKSCRLHVWRHEGGRLDLYVYRVYPDYGWNAGHGTLVSNEALGE